MRCLRLCCARRSRLETCLTFLALSGAILCVLPLLLLLHLQLLPVPLLLRLAFLSLCALRMLFGLIVRHVR